MPSDLIDQRREQLTGRAYPSGQSGATEIHAFPGIDLRLPIQRKVIPEFRDQHMRQQAGTWQAVLDRPRRSGCFDNPFTARSGELRPQMLNHLIGRRNAFQLLGYVLAELTQCTTTNPDSTCVQAGE